MHSVQSRAFHISCPLPFLILAFHFSSVSVPAAAPSSLWYVWKRLQGILDAMRSRIFVISRKPGVNATINEPRHDKTNNVVVRPAKTQISLGIRPVWSESSLSAWRKHGSLAIYWTHSEDSDQTGRMPRLIWVFAGRTLILFVLSCRSSIIFPWKKNFSNI